MAPLGQLLRRMLLLLFHFPRRRFFRPAATRRQAIQPVVLRLAAMRRAAMSPAAMRALHPLRLFLGLVAIAVLQGSLASGAKASDRSRERMPLLFGGAVEVHRPQVPVDPLLPEGQLRFPFSPPGDLPHKRCSFKRPVCVRAASPPKALRAVGLLEQAFERVALGYGLTLGGLSPHQTPLVWHLTGEELRIRRTPRPSRGFDRAQATCWGGPTTLAAAVSCVAQASIAVHAPATSSWLRKGLGEYAAFVDQGPRRVMAAVRAAQQSPHQGVWTRWEDARFAIAVDFLSRFSPAAAPLRASSFALRVAGTKTTPQAPRWNAEPDILDVLRVNLGGDRERMARWFDDLAVFRYEGDSRLLEHVQRPSLAWDIKATTLPRTLVLPHPLYPGGSAYVRLELNQPNKGPIALRTYCEPPVNYVWSLLTLDSSGKVLRRVPVAYREQRTQVQARVGQLDSAHALVAVGTNLGGVDLAHPFDPDHAPHEAHTCRVTFNQLPTPGDASSSESTDK